MIGKGLKWIYDNTIKFRFLSVPFSLDESSLYTLACCPFAIKESDVLSAYHAVWVIAAAFTASTQLSELIKGQSCEAECTEEFNRCLNCGRDSG